MSLNMLFPHLFAAAIENPYNREFNLFRNPRERSSGKLVSLSDFLNLAKNSSSLVGVLISVEVCSTITFRLLSIISINVIFVISFNCYNDYDLFASECIIPEREARARCC